VKQSRGISQSCTLCVYRQLLCLFERTKRFINQLRLSNGDRVGFPMPVTLGLWRGTFPARARPPFFSTPQIFRRSCRWSWTFFAFNFIASWPSFWVDCLCYRKAAKRKGQEKSGKVESGHLKCQDSCLGWVSWSGISKCICSRVSVSIS